MNIYIDFDGTLFNTDQYTRDFMKIFNDYSIDNILFEKIKNKLFSNEKLFNLNVIIHYLLTHNNIDYELQDKIDSLLNSSYLFPEVHYCLKELINIGYDLYLLTYGDDDFQTFKINASNIAKYFKEIIITNKDKSELNLDYENSIFIDNNPVEIEKIYNSKPKTLIRIKRDCDRYTKEKCKVSDIIECKDFNQVVKYLKGGFVNE